jgi:hypothetical protein
MALPVGDRIKPVGLVKAPWRRPAAAGLGSAGFAFARPLYEPHRTVDTSVGGLVGCGGALCGGRSGRLWRRLVGGRPWIGGLCGGRPGPDVAAGRRPSMDRGLCGGRPGRLWRPPAGGRLLEPGALGWATWSVASDVGVAGGLRGTHASMPRERRSTARAPDRRRALPRNTTTFPGGSTNGGPTDTTSRAASRDVTAARPTPATSGPQDRALESRSTRLACPPESSLGKALRPARIILGGHRRRPRPLNATTRNNASSDAPSDRAERAGRATRRATEQSDAPSNPPSDPGRDRQA